ncbi:unnamed protein product [Nippostrongylus brasiliensis]|uniref:ethanolamine-phosphate cytidylyltransferase n=1 Tax=Nippostrongylus brasiliensis TaxID=27835 RepID=A0A0N4XUX8_NIPBR|nr:unnamed protein product [Nippostrongylus brasiliensis]
MVHFGDIYQIREARKFGNSVVIGMYSDEDIMEITGRPPVFNRSERRRLLSGLKFVDKVVENVPYKTSLSTMNGHNCQYCAIEESLGSSERFSEVRKAGRFVTTRRAFEISEEDITERVLDFHSAVQHNSAVHLPWQKNVFLATSETFKLLANGAKPNPKDKVVYVCGTFDFFNIGHLAFLEKAKKLGDYMIVGVYADEDVVKSKGYHPIMSLYERVLSTFAYKPVDEVIIGAPLSVTDELIERFKIDVVVEGTVGSFHDESHVAIPIKRGIYRHIESDSDVTTESVLQRIVESRSHDSAGQDVNDSTTCKNKSFDNVFKSQYPVEQLG